VKLGVERVGLFLAPHNDDETLFGSYILLRHRPLVLVCFDGRRRRDYVPANVREAETAAAMEILGCEYRQLHVPCDPPNWQALEAILLKTETPDEVWAPLPEPDGHSQHNGVGELAARVWPGRVVFYTTYTMQGGRSTQGTRVAEEYGWNGLKERALACYRSQIGRPGTRAHFERGLAEYVVAGDTMRDVA
jgi:LmbE family N-acetylglucosaminyl deacetylase